MRVGFDTTPLQRACPPGVARAARETLQALEQRGRLEVVRLDPPARGSLSSWRRSLARVEQEQGLVGIHSFLSAFPCFPLRGTGARVQTLHELPWKHGVAENADLAHRLWARLGPLRADATVVPTEHVARDVGRKLASSGGKLHVIGWGVSEHFAPEPPPGVIDEVLLERYRLPEGPFLLCLGAVRQKKNLAALLHGLAHLAATGRSVPHVVISGRDTPDLRRDLGLVSRLGLARHVSTPGELEEQDLPGLLRLAAAVPVLSRSEGFGLPALEATACGTPVIAPRGSAQAEVAGAEAFLCHPEDPAAVAEAVASAVEQREELRWVLPDAAEGRSWQSTAEALESLWAGLA